MQEPPKVDETVKGRFESSNGMVIETLGGCRIGTPDLLSCWDMEGKPDAELTKQIRNGLVGSSQEINFRFGREIRCLVVRRNRPTSVQYRTVGNDYLNSFNLQRGSEERQYDLLFLRSDPDAKTFDIIATISGADKPLSAEVPFRKGARTRLGNSEYEVGVAVPFKVPKPDPNSAGNFQRWGGGYPYYNGTFYPDSKLWRLGIGYDKIDERASLYTVVALDKEGKPIRYVDKNGVPTRPTDVLAEQPPMFPGFPNDPNAKPPKYRAGLVQRLGNDVDGAFSFTTNIDPKFVAKLQLYSNPTRVVRFEGIPLDAQNP